jgi:hemolysin III
MRGAVGYTVFGVVFISCGVGILLNVIDVERFMKVSLALYVVAGWTIAIAIKPYYEAIGFPGILLLVLGGISYTVGIFFYKAKSVKYMHIIWHLFVLLGSIFHYLMVYFYCI